MLHQFGLVLGLAGGLALAIDLLGSRARRRAVAPFGWMAVVVTLWCGGELMLGVANTPHEVITARRVLFLGPCLFPAMWLWAAWSAAGHRLGRARLAAILAFTALEGVAYSFLWWDEAGRFMDWYARPPVRGPVFMAHTVLAHTAVAVGFFTFVRFAIRASHADLLPRIAAVGAGVAPFVANVLYITTGVPAFDPTPMVLIGVGFVFRAVVLGGTFAPYFVSFARAELLDQVDAGILVADVTGRVVETNAAARRLTGVERAEGQRLHDLVSRARSRAGEAIVCREFPLRRRGAIAGHGAVLFERSDDRHREQDLEMGRRLAGLGFLAAGVAHEIDGPLDEALRDLDQIEVVLEELGHGSLPEGLIAARQQGLARAGIDLLEECRDGLERIEQTLGLLAGLASRQHDGQARPVPLMEPVSQAVDLARLGQRARVRVVQYGELPEVLAVRENVAEIVLQLLTNALESDPGGMVQIRLAAAGGGATVEVVDRGPGIAKDELASIFDPFAANKPADRRRLGLSFALELARRHGGRLTAENRDEGGACFRLWLPAAPRKDRPS